MIAPEVFLPVLLGGLIVGILSGVPAFAAIGGVPLLVAFFAALFGAFDLSLLAAFPQRIYGVMGNQLLAAVPLFILMGVVLEKSGLARDMLLSMTAKAGEAPRKMAFGVLGISALIAASTGVVGATIVMLGLMAYPALIRIGMGERLASGLIVSAGTLGQIIPPSIVLIILADQVSNAWQGAQRAKGSFAVEPVTVSELFVAALLPGLLLVGLYALYLFFAVKPVSENHDQPETSASRSAISKSPFIALVLPLVLILAVLGSIILGIATATEAAAIGAAGSLLLAGKSLLRPGVFNEILAETINLCGVIFAIVFAASLLSLVFRGLGGDEWFVALAGDLPGDKWTALLLVMIVVFLLGFVLEFIEIIFIIVPIAGPVLFAMDIDPIWFAILMAVNLQTSFLTPPFGVALFYFKSVAPGGFALMDLYRGIVPFIGLQLVALLLIFVFPQIVSVLPDLLLD